MAENTILTESENFDVLKKLIPGTGFKLLFTSDSDMGESTEFFLGESVCRNWTTLWVRSSFMEEEGIFAVACIQGNRNLDKALAVELVNAFFATQEEFNLGCILDDPESMLTPSEVRTMFKKVWLCLKEEGESSNT